MHNCYYLKGTHTKTIGTSNSASGNNGDVTEIEDITDFPDVLEVINSDNAFKEDTNK